MSYYASGVFDMLAPYKLDYYYYYLLLNTKLCHTYKYVSTLFYCLWVMFLTGNKLEITLN